MLTVPSDHPQSSFISKNPTPRKTVEMPPDSSSLPVVQSRDLGHLRRTSAAPGAGNFVSRPRHLPTKQGSLSIEQLMLMLMSSFPFMHWWLSAWYWKCNILVSNDVLLECKDFPILLLYPEFQVFCNLERPSGQTFPVNNGCHLPPYLWEERWGMSPQV